MEILNSRTFCLSVLLHIDTLVSLSVFGLVRVLVSATDLSRHANCHFSPADPPLPYLIAVHICTYMCFGARN